MTETDSDITRSYGVITKGYEVITKGYRRERKKWNMRMREVKQ